MSSPIFPFSAIIGQEDVCRALMAVAVDQTIGGILIFGDRGTGKSTAVRALAGLLPPIQVVRDCRFNCDPAANQLCDECAARKKPLATTKVSTPVVDLPLGATEDRIVGALDLEAALTRGEKVLEAGLLARANRGFLYIDEVNLLEDHLVDLLLDVAASGENVIEREGLSIRHSARFVLIGSGNPEEGELRPQLLDRFGLAVDVRTPTDLDTRVNIVKLRDAYERNPQAFVQQWKGKDAHRRRKIAKGRKLLGTLQVSDQIIRCGAALCAALGTDGLRGELTLIRTARAFAAIDGKSEVEMKHLREAAAPALRHRLRRDPLDETDSGTRVARAVEEHLGP